MNKKLPISLLTLIFLTQISEVSVVFAQSEYDFVYEIKNDISLNDDAKIIDYTYNTTEINKNIEIINQENCNEISNSSSDYRYGYSIEIGHDGLLDTSHGLTSVSQFYLSEISNLILFSSVSPIYRNTILPVIQNNGEVVHSNQSTANAYIINSSKDNCGKNLIAELELKPANYPYLQQLKSASWFLPFQNSLNKKFKLEISGIPGDVFYVNMSTYDFTNSIYRESHDFITIDQSGISTLIISPQSVNFNNYLNSNILGIFVKPMSQTTGTATLQTDF